MSHDLYIRRTAWLHSADPRAKLILVLLMAIALIISRDVLPLALALLITQILALSSKLPGRLLLGVWRALWPLAVLILTLSSITYNPTQPALVQLGRFAITLPSLLNAACLALRVSAMAFLILLLLWTTEQGELIAGLTRLKIPHSISLTFAIAIQLVPTLGRIAGEILEAQQARGLQVSRRNPLSAGRAYLPVLVPLLITALRMVDNLEMALSARAYSPGAPRSCRRILHMSSTDWAVVAGSVGAMLAAGLIRVL